MPSGMNYSTAEAFLPNGDIVGAVWNDKGDAKGGVWSQKSKAFVSLSPPSGCQMTAAMGVAGESIAGYARNASGDVFVPTLWKNGTPTTLPVPKKHLGFAQMGNVHGAIIGEIFDGKKLSGVVWQGGKMQTLQRLNSEWVQPQAINTRGEIAGYALQGKAYHVFYWSSALAKPIDLSPNTDSAFAFDMNDNGQIVGYVGSKNPVATLWQNGKATDLNTTLPKNSGWVLWIAKTISADGKVIAGLGEYRGKLLAYRLRL
jgi:probable HAF family extracellular repeat protein